jgi:hypothetical protein
MTVKVKNLNSIEQHLVDVTTTELHEVQGGVVGGEPFVESNRGIFLKLNRGMFATATLGFRQVINGVIIPDLGIGDI